MLIRPEISLLTGTSKPIIIDLNMSLYNEKVLLMIEMVTNMQVPRFDKMNISGTIYRYPGTKV